MNAGSAQTMTLALAMALCAPAPASAQQSLESEFGKLASSDMETRSSAFHAMIAPFSEGNSNTVRGVTDLLRAHPGEAEQIKTALIKALEVQNAEYEKMTRENQQAPPGFSDYGNELAIAVAALRDPRAVKALLDATAGGALALEGLVDICSTAADTIIEKSRTRDGNPAAPESRPFVGALYALGECLKRPQALRDNPEVASKLRRELLADLEDRDWGVRLTAARALSPLRTDLEVRAKLRLVAATDPYVTPIDRAQIEGRGKLGVSRFAVREIAVWALDPGDEFSFYVMRTPQTLECRVQQASEPPAGEEFIGPDRRVAAQRNMCSHYDPTRADPSLCWVVYPANVCSQ